MGWEPDYCTLPELKSFMRITNTDDDALLPNAITAASRAIDAHTHRQFGQLAAPALWSYKARYDFERCRWVVDVDDFMVAAGLVVSVPLVGTTTDFVKESVNAAARGRPWTRIVFNRTAIRPIITDNYQVDVTAQWGWLQPFPVAVKHAQLLQASRFAKRRDAPFGVAGSPDTGSEVRLLAKVDPDVAVSLANYRRIGKVA